MYLNYCRGLRFEEAPDYMYLRQLFRILFRTLNHQYDYTFDWTLLKQKAAASASSASTLPGGLPPAGECGILCDTLIKAHLGGFYIKLNTSAIAVFNHT